MNYQLLDKYFLFRLRIFSINRGLSIMALNSNINWPTRFFLKIYQVIVETLVPGPVWLVGLGLLGARRKDLIQRRRRWRRAWGRRRRCWVVGGAAAGDGGVELYLLVLPVQFEWDIIQREMNWILLRCMSITDHSLVTHSTTYTHSKTHFFWSISRISAFH